LYANVSGSYNVAIGIDAGRYYNAGSYVANNSAISSVFIGYKAASGANGSTNEIVIGKDAVGLGSNSTVIGNSSTTKAKIFGALEAGGLTLPYVAKTATYTITATDYTVDCTANTFTVTLPTAVGIQGKIYNIKNTGTGVITVDGDGAETIDGETTETLEQWETLTIQSTNVGWIIL